MAPEVRGGSGRAGSDPLAPVAAGYRSAVLFCSRVRDPSGAAQRAAALKDRYAFKTEMDDEARRVMFPHNERLKA